MIENSISNILRKSAKDSVKYSLLDKHWVEPINYGIFNLPQNLSEDAINIWIESSSSLVALYSSLLIMPFDAFWCELIHQRSISLSISSFLSKCPRNFNKTTIPCCCFDLIRQLYALAFLIIVRCSSPIESESMCLSTQEFSQMIYDNFVFDVPRLIDVVILYGNEHKELVLNILQTVYSVQPAYVLDTIKTINASKNVLMNCKNTIQNWQFDTQHQPLSSDRNAFKCVEDMIDYVSDAGCTIGTFLCFVIKVFPSISERLIEIAFHLEWAQFYDDLIVSIKSHILRQMTWTFEQRRDLIQRLSVGATAFVKTFREAFVEPGFLNPIMHFAFAQDASTKQSQALSNVVVDFFELMSKVLDIRGFSVAYATVYDVDSDVELLKSTAKPADLDQTQIEYIRNAFSLLTVEMTAEQVNDVKQEQAPPSIDVQLRHHEAESDPPQAGPSRSSEFNNVKFVMPTTSDGLIERCLTHYNQDCNAVINALLEDSVPIEVKTPKLVRPNVPEKSTAFMNLAEAAATGVVQLKPSQLWQGKRGVGDAAGPAIVPSLSKKDQQRVLNLAVSVWDDEDEGGWNQVPLNQNFDMYEDEYDDSYDIDVGTMDTAAGGSDEEQIAKELREAAHLEAKEKQQRQPCKQHPLEKQSIRGEQRLLKPSKQQSLQNVDKKLPDRREPQQIRQQQQHHRPTVNRDIGDVRIILDNRNQLHNTESDNEENVDSVPPVQRDVLRIENPEIVRDRREHYRLVKATNRGHCRSTNPRNVPDQPLPEGGTFFPEIQRPQRLWCEAPGARSSPGVGALNRNDERLPRRNNIPIGNEEMPPRGVSNAPSKSGYGFPKGRGFTKSGGSCSVNRRADAPQQDGLDDLEQSHGELRQVRGGGVGGRGGGVGGRGRGRGRSYRDPHNQRYLADRKQQF